MADRVQAIVKAIADRHRLRLDVAADVIREFAARVGHGLDRKVLRRCPDCTDGTVREMDPAGSMSDFECGTCLGFVVVESARGRVEDDA